MNAKLDSVFVPDDYRPIGPPEHGPGPDHDKPIDPLEGDGAHK